jgi:hypothetical protein
MIKVMQLSAHAFADLGLDEIAYIRSIAAKGGPVYEIRAADGSFLALVADRATAIAALRRHELSAASLH